MHDFLLCEAVYCTGDTMDPHRRRRTCHLLLYVAAGSARRCSASARKSSLVIEGILAGRNTMKPTASLKCDFAALGNELRLFFG